jgi:hypothetical protein
MAEGIELVGLNLEKPLGGKAYWDIDGKNLNHFQYFTLCFNQASMKQYWR